MNYAKDIIDSDVGLREKILKLAELPGYTNARISRELSCARSTVQYHREDENFREKRRKAAAKYTHDKQHLGPVTQKRLLEKTKDMRRRDPDTIFNPDSFDIILDDSKVDEIIRSMRQR